MKYSSKFKNRMVAQLTGPGDKTASKLPKERQVTLETISNENIRRGCRSCDADNPKLLFTINANRILQCRDCSHVFLDTSHSQQSLRTLYTNYGDKGDSKYFQGISQQVIDNIDGYLDRCIEHCSKHHDATIQQVSPPTLTASNVQKIKLLDIGCGNGLLLERAQKKGISIEGVDICETLAQKVRSRLGCPVHTKFIQDLKLPSNSFDVVTMYDLLEHLESPGEDLATIAKLLKPGGILFILTPNDSALVRMISRLMYRLSIHWIEKPMRVLYYRDHLSYFTLKSLTGLVERTGFEIVSWTTQNQELSRLQLKAMEQVAVSLIFSISNNFQSLGGKHIIYAQKRASDPERLEEW